MTTGSPAPTTSEPGNSSGGGRRAAHHLLSGAVAVALFMAAAWILHRELSNVRFSDVVAAFYALPASAVVIAALCAAGSFAAMTGYDMLALRHLGKALPYASVAPASFIATVVGQNVGFAVVSGGAIRYRMYTALGLGTVEIATLIAFVAVTFGMGISVAAGIAFVIQPEHAARLLGIPTGLVQTAGAALFLPALTALALAVSHRDTFRLGIVTVDVPGVRTVLAQIFVALFDLTCAAGVLYALLALGPGNTIPFPTFAGAYIIAIVAGIVSHVPGGLGVIEGVLLLTLPEVPRTELLGAILAYRVIYYLLPLIVAGVWAALHETGRHRERVRRLPLAFARDALETAIPQLLALVVFMTGAMLLFSGATPALRERLAIVSQLLPLPVIELSHLAGSILGLGLMVLARGLQRRSALAYQLALVSVVIGAAVSIAKGLDWEEALILSVVGAILYGVRDGFDRATGITLTRLNGPWLLSVAMVVAGSVWLAAFAFRHVEYGDALWWRFAFDANAPRSMRAGFVVVLLATVMIFMRLLRARPPVDRPLTGEQFDRVREIVRASPKADAALALLGDKRFLLSDDGGACLMYQIQGRSWIALGDTLGDETAAEELDWQFLELVDEYEGRPVFYHVDADAIHRYVDMGLSPFKIGEEAIVDLTTFSLEGSARAELRQVNRKVEREGARFEIVEVAGVPAIMQDLASVSGRWLEDKNTREKGFALGRFDEDYFANFPVALVRREEAIVAFANIWAGAGRGELTVDLMRHSSDAPKAVMDYLFVQLMLWGKAQGYRTFSFGMAPLSGLESHALAPLWHRIGTVIFRQGEYFYNFEGLRAYKDKFDPEWRGKYIVTKSGVGLAAALVDVSTLIAGGVVGVIRR